MDNFKSYTDFEAKSVLRRKTGKKDTESDWAVARLTFTFVCNHGFVDIAKLRNKMAEQLGFVDYYDFKVSNAKGFNKARLFEILDGLEEGTRPLMPEGRKELERRFGKSALKPWNTSFMMAGSIVKKCQFQRTRASLLLGQFGVSFQRRPLLHSKQCLRYSSQLRLNRTDRRRSQADALLYMRV